MDTPGSPRAVSDWDDVRRRPREVPGVGVAAVLLQAAMLWNVWDARALVAISQWRGR